MATRIKYPIRQDPAEVGEVLLEVDNLSVEFRTDAGVVNDWNNSFSEPSAKARSSK